MRTSKLRKNSTRNLWLRIRRNWELYLLLLPAVVLLICFTYKPMYGVLIAFKEYRPVKGIWGSEWVLPWFKYFKKYFDSYQFVATIKNTLTITLYSLIVFPVPVVLALSVNQMRGGRFKKVFQTVTYMPHFISTVVMIGLLTLLLSPGSGIFGTICNLLGVEAPNLLGKAGAFKHLYVWSDIWQHAGWDSIIYIAALSGVDPSLYEAATVDGASKMQKVRFIDIPMLIPTAVIMLIMRVGGLMSLGFEKVYLMQNDLNIASSEVISTYVYKIGVVNTQYSYSAAINLFSTIVNFILLIMVNKIAKSISENSLW
ncbi:ABC transporter permease [Anaerocolumna xylanovorans]|uniref:Putative aldouronate transport system permease protein n=1 Tax=Anaerocolumna xylanovorans DSM 12503 TaxID=1121345 RepID=A0A1M7Y4Y5_9FIRM|nr:ABC transporter permease subunit [Anaerocolumna xylanovorans]SHO47368.1 putative aldouronate transport system permease protein [Anaerocolumna xylanovorans DSM 12503]